MKPLLVGVGLVGAAAAAAYYLTQGDTKRRIAPELFVVPDTRPMWRHNWLVWEDGVPPFVVELLIEETAHEDLGGKFRFYRDELRVPERYSRPSMNYLMVQVTVDDPKVLVKPWSSATRRWTLGDGEVYEFYCTNNKELEELQKLRALELQQGK